MRGCIHHFFCSEKELTAQSSPFLSKVVMLPMSAYHVLSALDHCLFCQLTQHCGFQHKVFDEHDQLLYFCQEGEQNISQFQWWLWWCCCIIIIISSGFCLICVVQWCDTRCPPLLMFCFANRGLDGMVLVFIFSGRKACKYTCVLVVDTSLWTATSVFFVNRAPWLAYIYHARLLSNQQVQYY